MWTRVRVGVACVAACLLTFTSATAAHADPASDLRQRIRAAMPTSGAIHATYTPVDGIGEVSIGWRAPADGYYFVTQLTTSGRNAEGRAFAGQPMFTPGVVENPSKPPLGEEFLDHYTPHAFYADLLANPDRYRVEARPDGGWIVSRECPQAVRTMTPGDVAPGLESSYPIGTWRIEIDTDLRPISLFRSSPNWGDVTETIRFEWSARVPAPWLLSETAGPGKGWRLASFEVDEPGHPERFSRERVSKLGMLAYERHQKEMAFLAEQIERKAGRLPKDPRADDPQADRAWHRMSYATIAVGAVLIVVGAVAIFRRRTSP